MDNCHTALSIGAGLLRAITAVWPAFFPAIKLIYKTLLGLSIGFGGVIGLLSYFSDIKNEDIR